MWGLSLRLIAAAVLVAGCGSGGGSHTAETATGAGDLTARSQRALDDAIEPDAPGCSAAVGIEGKVAWTGVRGIADLSTGAKITADTVFDIASVSKQFTATAILLQTEAGSLGLDDPLSDHVAGLPAWATTVRVAQLMHQTSSIPDYVNLLQDNGYQYSDRTTQADALAALSHTAWEQVGDGAIHTTPSQLVRWADNYRTGKVGGSELLRAQLAGAVETGDQDPESLADGIGKLWM
jgi:CubicO group peptidase (beta-lactamase class C family)